MFSPAFIPNTSFRFDSVFIYLIIPFLLIHNKRLKFLNINKTIVISLFIFVLSIFIALILQIFFIPEMSVKTHVLNFAGFLRMFLFSLLAFFTITTFNRALIITKIFLFCTIIQSLILIIQYAQVYPLSNFISWFYNNSNNETNVYRAVGSFNAVHSAAYYFLYFFLFSLSIYISSEHMKIKNLALIAVCFSFIGLVLPVSKGAYLALFVSLTYLILVRKAVGIFIKSIIFLTCFLIFSALLIPRKKIEYFQNQFIELYEGAKWILFSTDIGSYDHMGFIAGRLDHGWKNAIDNWVIYPVYGNIDTSVKTFIGDGGYTEILSNSGLIGLFGFLIMLLILFFSSSSTKGRRSNVRCVFENTRKTIVIAIFFASIATGFLKQRTVELLPVMLVTLSSLSIQPKEDKLLKLVQL